MTFCPCRVRTCCSIGILLLGTYASASYIFLLFTLDKQIHIPFFFYLAAILFDTTLHFGSCSEKNVVSRPHHHLALALQLRASSKPLLGSDTSRYHWHRQSNPPSGRISLNTQLPLKRIIDIRLGMYMVSKKKTKIFFFKVHGRNKLEF